LPCSAPVKVSVDRSANVLGRAPQSNAYKAGIALFLMLVGIVEAPSNSRARTARNLCFNNANRVACRATGHREHTNRSRLTT
jgi:hypothetical protein